MTAKRIFLDPTSEHTPAKQDRLVRPTSLKGLTIGLLDISKAKGNVFLDQVESQLNERGLKVKRYQKPTFARIAPEEIKQSITAECDVIVEALAD